MSAALEPRYHVPRSQVWEGSRGRQHGHVHLHVLERYDHGRIHRAPGQALCGKRGWYERRLHEAEIAPLCPRCRELSERSAGDDAASVDVRDAENPARR